MIAVLITLGLAIYVNSFANAMFWDDDDFILKNQYIKDWQYLPRFFSENVISGAGFISNYWRPFLLFIFSLEWHAWGFWPPGFHAVNTGFHIAVAILLFFFLKHLFKNRTLAFLTSVLFLVHPVHTEAVVYVNSLGDSLSSFFMLLGLIFYLKFRDSRDNQILSNWHFLALLMYACALLSKESGFILVGLIALSDFFYQYPNKSFKEKLLDVLKFLWPFLLLAGIYVYLRATVLNFNSTFNFYKEENLFTSNVSVRLFTFFHVLTVYFGLLFWPADLHVERSVAWATNFFDPSVIGGAAVFVVLLGGALINYRRWPILSFGVFWFFGALLPSSNILIPINAVLYEHWLYVPMIGISLIVVDVGFKLADRFDARRLFMMIFIAIVLALSFRTVVRNFDWRDPINFYEKLLTYAPKSYRVINNLGMMYAERGNLKKAESIYHRAIANSPDNPVAYHNLGNLYKATGQTRLAILNYETALAKSPKFLFSYGNLVNLYLQSNDLVKARRVLEQFLQFSDNKSAAFYYLAQITYQQKDYASCLGYLKEAERLLPHNKEIEDFIRTVEKLTTHHSGIIPYRPL